MVATLPLFPCTVSASWSFDGDKHCVSIGEKQAQNTQNAARLWSSPQSGHTSAALSRDAPPSAHSLSAAAAAGEGLIAGVSLGSVASGDLVCQVGWLALL